MSIISKSLAAAPGSYATAAEVRVVSGLSSTNDIIDADLNEIILNATLDFIGDVTIRRSSVLAQVTDTARTIFQLPHGFVADVTGDASVTTSDLNVRFVKQNTDGSISTSATGTVTITSDGATAGVFSTANALPTDYDCIVDYAHYLQPLDLVRAKRAVRYLAAHLAYTRVRSPGRISRADLSNVATESPPRAQFTRFLMLYNLEVHRINGQAFV